MTRIQGDHFDIDRQRLSLLCEAAEAAGIHSEDPEVNPVARVLIDYDWAEGDEHQHWIDTAPIPEIVSWIRHVLDTGRG